MDAAQQLIEQGRAARRDGNLTLAIKLYQAAANLLRPLDQPLRLAHTIRHVADIQWSALLFEESRANYAEAVAIYRTNPDAGKLDLANTLRGYALLSESIADIAAASELWTEARDVYEAVGVQAGVEEADRRLAKFHNS